MSESAEITDLAERLRERDERKELLPPSMREAYRCLSPLMRDLPATETYLLAPQAVDAWRVLRDEDPEAFLIYIGAVRTKCGNNVALVVSSRVGPPRSRPKQEIVLMSPKDLRAIPIRRDLLAGVFPDRGLGVVQGAPGCGKSFLIDHCVMSLAADITPIPGRKYRQTAGVIIGAEGRRMERLDAWSRHHGIALDDLPVRVIEQALDLRTPGADIDPLLEALARVEREIGRIGVLAIDTLSRTMGGGNENSPEDLGAYVGNMGRIADVTGGLVLAVHHVGKDPTKGGRGHSLLNGALDVELTITRKENGARVAEVTKMRAGKDGDEFAFELQVVDLGPHPDPEAAAEGQAWNSCVVVWTDVPVDTRSNKPRIPPGAQVALDALQQAIAAHGERMPGTSAIPRGVHAVVVDRWQDAYASLRPIGKRLPEDEQKKEINARRMAFKRAQDQLQAARTVGTGAGFWWVN